MFTKIARKLSNVITNEIMMHFYMNRNDATNNSQITLTEGAGQTFRLAGMAFYYSYHFYYFSSHRDAEKTLME